MNRTAPPIFSDARDPDLAATTTDESVARRDRQRHYDVSFLAPNNDLVDMRVKARALPSIEKAFAALSHSAIVQTDRGHLAVADVWPGDKVRLSDGQFETLLWRGSIVLTPNPAGSPGQDTAMTRITADTLGPNRPDGDLLLGPSARLLHRSPAIKKLTGKPQAFIPAADFVDGNTVLSVQPVRPTPVYQFGFDRHTAVNVGGLAVETLYPGSPFNLGLRGDALAEYLSLFPHKASFDAFGLAAFPPLRLRDLDLLS